MSGRGTSLNGAHSPDWEAQSRPSKTNCTTAAEGAETAKERGGDSPRRQWWREKNRLVDQFLEEMPQRAARPVSVRGGTTLREEATSEKFVAEDARDDLDDPRRGRTWSDVLREFLGWYNDYRYAHLRFKDPDGELVRTPMRNSHQPDYGDKYYARIKALERQMLKKYENPCVTMLTFTGSTTNANDCWRCPVDHLRDVIESWRPDEGRGVYHYLRDALAGKEWEYALVVEKHKSGYGHVHVAVFVDGVVSEDDFHPVIDAHLRNCKIAHRDAHDYYAEDVSTRPISVRKVEPEAGEDRQVAMGMARVFEDQEEVERAREDFEAVSNLGSYVGEYIGSHGEALFDRSLEELIFRAAAWASGTQRVRFSTGANEMIENELEETGSSESIGPITVENPEYDPEKHANNETEQKPYEVVEGAWSIDGIGRVDRDGEDVFEVQQSGVSWVDIEDASHLDPPKELPADRPRPTLNDQSLDTY